jgi:hypothetical protein
LGDEIVVCESKEKKVKMEYLGQELFYQVCTSINLNYLQKKISCVQILEWENYLFKKPTKQFKLVMYTLYCCKKHKRVFTTKRWKLIF